ncbi:circadian clock protein KaiC [Rhodoligotrophos appendicifer]|uniref:ATPase domain-containing protein n=1 Tax=Rhodoligotrophos appendicifer TaxID=987056 RepID=UPI001185D21E|nr:ATPase domain-containing protein [Rhodoligotrophos appendicifer]
MTEDTLELARVPTGIPGLDDILEGGVLKGGVYIIQGAPGAGKTILANQICFDTISRGGKAVFITLLAESHTRMIQHLRSMSFFDFSAIPNKLYYVSGFDILENQGLKGVVDLLRREILGHKANLLVLDGFGITEEAAPSQREFKKFIHEIQSHAAAAECTVILLTNGTKRITTPEYTMVDGLIALEDEFCETRAERTLYVSKFRGSSFLRGRHSFRITTDGLVVFPRLEAISVASTDASVLRPQRMSLGVDSLDAILHGGLTAPTTTGVFGPTGAGKTTLGLQFVSMCDEDEPGLFFGFFESPERLRAKAAALQIDLEGLEARGDVEILWRPLGEHILDELGHDILSAVRRRKVKRLFIDGFAGFRQASINPERMTRYISALSNQLRGLGVTTIMSMESREILGHRMQLPIDGMSSLLEGLIVMRFAEIGGLVARVISITKLRDSDFDPYLRQYTISEKGIHVGGTFTGVEAILSGYGREPHAISSDE